MNPYLQGFLIVVGLAVFFEVCHRLDRWNKRPGGWIDRTNKETARKYEEAFRKLYAPETTEEPFLGRWQAEWFCPECDAVMPKEVYISGLPCDKCGSLKGATRLVRFFRKDKGGPIEREVSRSSMIH